MKSLISIIIIGLLGIGVQAIAETDAERAEYERLKRVAEEARKEIEKWKVVLVDKGPGWSRHMFDGQELVIDGDHRKGTVYEFDLSDQTTIDRIVASVRTIRRYGKSCNVVIGFTHERVPAGVDRTTPRTRTLCDSGCIQLQEREKTEYGRRKRIIEVVVFNTDGKEAKERCSL